jgi:hypothetical protein
MNGFWIGSVAVIVVSAAVITVPPRLERSSEKLLGKAQSEFAAKARYTLIQRQMVHAPAATAATKPSVASLETTAIPKAIVREISHRSPRTLTAQDLESLRARSPELAAAMARYM